ncbi:hypothetical protein K9M47_02860, partial [Candidatus Gracilibacteria bacterium]|nr:hypothetical protein [Candidatus Gracilibacteria bacterium]
MQDFGKFIGNKISFLFGFLVISSLFFSTSYAQVVNSNDGSELFSNYSHRTFFDRSSLTKISDVDSSSKNVLISNITKIISRRNISSLTINPTTPNFGYNNNKPFFDVALNPVSDSAITHSDIKFNLFNIYNEVHCAMGSKLFFSEDVNCSIFSAKVDDNKFHKSKGILVSGTVSREISIVGSELSLPFVEEIVSNFIGLSRTDIFSKNALVDKLERFNVIPPRLSEIELLPVKQYQALVFSDKKVNAFVSKSNSQDKKTVRLLDQLSLGLYCKISSFSSTLNQKRCNYDILASGLLSSITSNATSSDIKLDEKNNLPAPVLFSTSTTVYITQYVPVPGPRGLSGRDGLSGKDGKDGKDGVDGVGNNSASNQVSYLPFFSNNVGGNVTNLTSTTITGGTFNSGTGSGLVLSSSTLNETTFGGMSIFNGDAFFNYNLTANTLTATSAIFVDATTTNSFVVTGTSTLATTTVSNLTITGSLFDSNNLAGNAGQILASNGTSTYWAYVTDVSGVIIGGSATSSTVYWNGSTWMENTNFLADQFGNLTAAGGLIVNGSSTLATTTITDLTSASGTITNLNSATATIANLITTNSSSTNSTSTNFFAEIFTAFTG